VSVTIPPGTTPSLGGEGRFGITLACLKTIIDLVHRQNPKFDKTKYLNPKFGELNILWRMRTYT
jgi:hypothetical protein